MGDKSRLDRWAAAVRESQEGICPHCWREGNAAHHIIGRENSLTRFVLENGIYVCGTLHRLFERTASESVEQIEFYVGRERYEGLLAVSRGIKTPEEMGFTVIE